MRKEHEQQLHDGAITVWQEEESMILHHVSGLTIELTVEEWQDLFAWLRKADAARRVVQGWGDERGRPHVV